MSKFKKYYQTFLNNMRQREKFKVAFEDDTEIICIPFSGSIATPDDEAEFTFIVEDLEGKQRTSKKTYSSIKNVEKVKT